MWLARPAAKVLWARHQKKGRRKKNNPNFGTPKKQAKSSKDRWWSGKETKPRGERWWSDSGRKISPEEEEMEMRRLANKESRLRRQDAEFAQERERFEKNAHVAKHEQKEAAEILREEHKDVKRAESDLRRGESDLRRKYAAFRAEREKLEDEKASIREEKRSLRLARERLREYSDRVRETIDRAVDYVGGYHEEDERLPTKQLWIRRTLFTFTGFPIIGLYIIVLTGCMANNVISRAFFTIDVFSGASDEFIVPNFRVGYFGICAIIPSTGKDICTPNFPYGRSASSAAAIVQSALFQGSTDTSTANNIELAVGIQQKLLPLILMPFFAFAIGLLWTIWTLPTSKMASAILQWSAGNMMSAAGSISTAGGAIQFVTSRSTGQQISRGVPLQIGQYLIALGCLGFAAMVGYIDKRGRRKAHEGFKMQFQVQEFKV
ncbi:a08fbda7-91f2-452e-8b27-42422a5f487a [Sclerotinia trifoliorum]|uniref:A08fbda7-91f2-452e-8b27-42422a5f487a n=1 Tax=Sclerotinia trifoliorum TaxID=28548 RepID=A0A8H2VPF0_9HELO|nr:a08fbda7-91f2-452e-8b27-42422a5f487a [Sclerotinia trifoliorum]